MRKNISGIPLTGTIESALIIGCGAASSDIARSSVPQQTQGSAPASDEAGTSTADTANLTGHTLVIYCGAGMIESFQEIADSSKPVIGCEMNIAYANAGQIQSQITASEEGNMPIAGSAEELKPIESYVSGSRALVKHVPVLTVQSGNPKNITSLSGLAAEGISFIISDADSTPIERIVKKALSGAGVLDKVQVTVSIVAAPQMVTAIAAGETDVAIIWKENRDVEGVEIVDNNGLEDYMKTTPAASLICSADRDARQVFLDYLDLGEVREI